MLCFWICNFLRTKWKPLIIPIIKSSHFLASAFIWNLNTLYTVRHTASKVDRIENGRQKNFRWRQKSTPVRSPSSHELGPHPIIQQQSKPLALFERTAPAAPCSFACILKSLELEIWTSKYESPYSIVTPTIFVPSHKKPIYATAAITFRNVVPAIMWSNDIFTREQYLKLLIKRRHPFLTKFVFKNKQFLRSVESTAWKIHQSNSKVIPVSPKAFVSLSSSNF